MRIDVEVPTTLSDLDFYAQIGAFVSFGRNVLQRILF